MTTSNPTGDELSHLRWLYSQMLTQIDPLKLTVGELRQLTNTLMPAHSKWARESFAAPPAPVPPGPPRLKVVTSSR